MNKSTTSTTAVEQRFLKLGQFLGYTVYTLLYLLTLYKLYEKPYKVIVRREILLGDFHQTLGNYLLVTDYSKNRRLKTFQRSKI